MFPGNDPRFRTQMVTAAGFRVRVIECGPSSARSPSPARTAVCLHGLGCSVYSYREVMPLLAAEGYRVVAIDLPGHGGSEKPDRDAVYSITTFVAVVREVLDFLQLQQVVMVGHSMGAPVAAELALQEQERVRALLLLTPAGFKGIWRLRLAQRLTPRWTRPLLAMLMGRWAIWVALRLAYGSVGEFTTRDVDEYWAPARERGWIRALWALVHRYEWEIGDRGHFRGITAPVTVICGGEDHLIPLEVAARYAQVIEQARCQTVSGAGHAFPDEVPEVVVQAVLDFETK